MENLLMKETLEEKNRQLEIALKNFENILNHLHQGILFINREMKLLSFNKAAEKILGAQYCNPAILEKCLEISLIEAFNKETIPRTLIHTLKTETGSTDIEISFSFVRDENRTIQGMILLIKDISELRRLQLIATRNDRLQELGEMAARLAHEIRNPLSGIQGFAALLARDLAGFPKLEKMAQAVIEGTIILNNLVSSVLDYTRPLTIHFEPVDIIGIVKKMLGFIEIQKKTEIKIELRSDCQELYLHIDANLMHSVFLNLALNALESMGDKGMLSIRIYKKNKEIWIIFSDTGIGIPKESVEKLFTPFFTTKKAGHGLGLAEVHKIIEAHNGKITVNSEYGKGTSFLITLPFKL